jgi:hypothetical protein
MPAIIPLRFSSCREEPECGTCGGLILGSWKRVTEKIKHICQFMVFGKHPQTRREINRRQHMFCSYLLLLTQVAHKLLHMECSRCLVRSNIDALPVWSCQQSLHGLC